MFKSVFAKYFSIYAGLLLAATLALGIVQLMFFNNYWIADRQGRSFKRLNELYAKTGQIGFVASQRVDGKLVLPEAIKVLQQKSAS